MMIAAATMLLSNWRLVAAGAAIVAAGLAGWTANGWRLETRVEEIRREHSDQVAAAASKVADAQTQQRAIELQRAAAQQEVNHVASLARSRAEDDRRAADAAGRRLLDAARDAAARASGASQDPAAAGSRETASAEPVRAFLDVLREADEEAGRMGAAVDTARAAGLGCQQYIDTLTAGQ